MPAATLVALATPPCDAYRGPVSWDASVTNPHREKRRSGVRLGPASRSGGWDIVSAHLLRIVFVEHHGAARPVLDDVSALVPSRLSFAGSQQGELETKVFRNSFRNLSRGSQLSAHIEWKLIRRLLSKLDGSMKAY